MRAVAHEEGFAEKLKRIIFKQHATDKSYRPPMHIAGGTDFYGARILLSTNTPPWAAGGGKRSIPRERFMQTAAHELAHAALAPVSQKVFAESRGETPEHRAKTGEYLSRIKAHAERLARQDRSYLKRKSASGGDWDESQHPRDENGRWEPK
jgi:hypothetical protein